MPEPVKDRCTKSHEYIFLLSKNPQYYFDYKAIQEPAKYWGPRDRTNGKYHKEGLAHGLTGTYFRATTSPHIRFGGNKYGDSDAPEHATKSGNYYQPTEMRNKRSVWTMPTAQFKDGHFATFPEELVRTCILAGSKEGDVVLDPFSGAGTSGLVANKLLRNYVGIELNPEYADMSRKRIQEGTQQERIFV